MPRRTNSTIAKRRSRSAPERAATTKGPRRATRDIDAQALALRESGNSFSAIARTLDLARATDAHRSFVRALGTQEDDQRRRLVDNESARLDRLETRIRERDAAHPAKVERRLLGVEKLREAIRQ